MKNIHLLPTDKPSSLYIGDNGSFVFGMIKTSTQSRNDDFTNQHIYITSDEEIEEGDWFTDDNNSLKRSYRLSHVQFANPKKIILTTDPDLIKDGVQAIDDEFLEWFVKNPTCEEVKTRKIGEEWIYNADVPQEEPKHISAKPFLDNANEVIVIHRPKQETLEEAAERVAKLKYGSTIYGLERVNAFKEGAKWQAERMYSEEDLEKAFFAGLRKSYSNKKHSVCWKEWFEQFKNK